MQEVISKGGNVPQHQIQSFLHTFLKKQKSTVWFEPCVKEFFMKTLCSETLPILQISLCHIDNYLFDKATIYTYQ